MTQGSADTTLQTPETQLIACHECDWVSEVQLDDPRWQVCPRCQHPLVRHDRNDQLTPALALSALALLLLALLQPYITFERSGIVRTMTITDATAELAIYHHPALAVAVLLTSIIIPAAYVLAICWVYAGMLLRRALVGQQFLVRWLPVLSPWMMADVFAMAALVSLVKIIALANVTLHIAFWAYLAFALLLLATATRLNTVHLWQRLLGHHPAPTSLRAGHTAHQQGYVGCPRCGQLQPLHTTPSPAACGRCHSPLPTRDPLTNQRVLAYLCCAILFCLPAHALPIMVTTSLGKTEPTTIIGGVMLFLKHGDWPIALIIFAASVLVPFGKIFALLWLCIATRHPEQLEMTTQMRLYRVTEWIGRWSMIDVFVVAITVALVQLGSVMSVAPGMGGVAFCAVVVFTMLAAHQFDPRLIWDAQHRIAVETSRDAI